MPTNPALQSQPSLYPTLINTTTTPTYKYVKGQPWKPVEKPASLQQLATVHIVFFFSPYSKQIR